MRIIPILFIYFILTNKKESSLKIGTYINDLALSSDGMQVAIAGEDGTLWHGNPLQNPTQQTLTEEEIFYSVTFDKDSRFLAAGHKNGEVWLWDLNKIQPGTSTTPDPIRLLGHKARVSQVQFAFSDSLLVSASYDGSIQIWDLSIQPIENQLPIVLDDHDGEFITALAIDSAKKLVYSGTNDGRIRLWFIDYIDLAKQLKYRLRSEYGPGSPREFTQLKKEMLKYTTHLKLGDSENKLFPWSTPAN